MQILQQLQQTSRPTCSNSKQTAQKMNTNKIDLIFQKQPPQVQKKLMNLLIQYNAMMRYNRDQDKFEVDLLFPFETPQQKKQFVQKFQSRNQRRQQNRLDPSQVTTKTKSVSRKNSMSKQQPSPLPVTNTNEGHLSVPPFEVAGSNQQQTDQQQQLSYDFTLSNQNQISRSHRNSINVRDVGTVIRGKLREAVTNIIANNQKERNKKKFENRQGIQYRVRDQIQIQKQLGQEKQQKYNDKNNDSLNEQNNQQNSGFQTSQMHEAQQQNTENMPELYLNIGNKNNQSYSKNSNNKSNERGNQNNSSQKSNSHSRQSESNMSSEIKKQIKIQQSPDDQYRNRYEEYQPANDQNQEDQQSRQGEYSDSKHKYFSSSKKYSNSSSGSAHLFGSGQRNRQTGHFRDQLQKLSQLSQSKQKSFSSQNQSHKSLLNSMKQNIRSSKQSAQMRQKYSDFVKHNRRQFQKIYEEIRKQLRKNQNSNQQKRNNKQPILILEEVFQQSVTEEDRVFKEEIVKDYQKHIVVHNRSMSSEDLVKYFRFLLKNAKQFYIQSLRRGK